MTPPAAGRWPLHATWDAWRGLSRQRRVLVVAATVIMVAVVGAYGVWRIMDARGFQLAGDLVSRVETTERVVALTFDDGPVEHRVEPILSALRQANVRATFFVVGEALAQHPESGKRLVAAGHQLANHTYTHPRMVFRSSDFYAREIEETDAQIRAAGFEGPILFRPPYGKKLLGLPLYLERTGKTSITWDVEMDADADVTGTAEQITAATLEQARPGSIVLLHPWYDSRGESVKAIGPIVAGLRERGYRFVTVSELLALRPQRP